MNKIFNPLELFQELTIEELKLLFHKIDKNVIHFLLVTQSKIFHWNVIIYNSKDILKGDKL